MANATEVPKPDEIGWLFVQQYYTMMNKKPANLHLFYKSKSSFVHGMEGEQVKLSQGQQEIHDRISDLQLKDCKVLVSNVDSQGALEGGILIQVLGEISNDGQESRKFAQTFSLAPQESGYYVYNDIFRFLKEDVESEFGDEHHLEAPTNTTAADLPVNGKPQNDTLFSSQSSAALQQAYAAEKIADAPEAQHGAVNPTVQEIEKAAEEPAHAPELAQEVVPSPTQTPVAPDEQSKQSSGVSDAVEAVALPPAVEKEVEAPKPSVPMSWAERAGANAAAKAQALASKAVAPKSVQAKAPQQPVDTDKRVQSSNNSVADVTRSAFLKNISPKMSDESIRAALKKFGDFKNVEINRNKSCGFVDYLDPASCAAAIKANKIVINGETMNVEERRRDFNGKIGPKEKRTEANKDNRGGDANRGGRGGARGGKASRGAATPK